MQRCIASTLVALGLVAVFPSTATAQTTSRPSFGGAGAGGSATPQSPAAMRAATLRRMTKSLTIEFQGERLEDVVTFFKDFAGVEIEAMWLDEGDTGLDRDAEVSLNVRNATALNALERILSKVGDEDFDAATWQLGEFGELQIGPRSRLNAKKVLKVYPIQDLILTIPNFANVPDLDIDSVLNQGNNQGGGGGGGGNQGSIFEEDENDDGPFGNLDEEEALKIIEIIETFVEPEQWQATGGDGGTIRYWKGNLLVRAPDYIHRQLNGYEFLPNGYRPFQPPRSQRPRAERDAAAPSDNPTAGGAGEDDSTGDGDR